MWIFTLFKTYNEGMQVQSLQILHASTFQGKYSLRVKHVFMNQWANLERIPPQNHKKNDIL